MYEFVLNIWNVIPSWVVIVFGVVFGGWALWSFLIFLMSELISAYLVGKVESFIISKIKKLMKDN